MNPGDVVFLRNDLGDFYEGQHVTVLAGTSGVVRGSEPNGTYTMIVIDIPDSPGQKMLRTETGDFHHLWVSYHPRPTRFERILLCNH